MTKTEFEDRLDRVEDRLREVLVLLANAPIETTTIPDDQGSYSGHDSFVSPSLRDEAAEILAKWDEEDAPSAPTSPQSGGDGTTSGDATS